MRPALSLLALALLVSQPASALLTEGGPADARVLEANVPAVITITGVMGSGLHQVTTPPLATCSTSLTYPGGVSNTVAVTCELPSPAFCGDVVLVQAMAASVEGFVTAGAGCGSQAGAWCMTQNDVDFPTDFHRCAGASFDPFDPLGVDPLATHAQTLTCSAHANPVDTRETAAYSVECVFPL